VSAAITAALAAPGGADECAYLVNNCAPSHPDYGTISVLNTATNTVNSTIPVDANPSAIVIDQAGQYAYVANQCGDYPQCAGPEPILGTVSVIDTASRTVAATVRVGERPRGSVAITPDGSFVYVRNEYSRDTSVIDTAEALADPANAVVATIPVYGLIAISPDGTIAYIGGLNISVRLWRFRVSP
jgi:YVTN family beta-propeller protein